MNKRKTALETLRDELQNLEKRLRQIEKQDQCSQIEADFLLDQIRKLYASGLDLQQAMTDASSGKSNSNQKRESHPEEIASGGTVQAGDQSKQKAEDNQAEPNTRSFSGGEGDSENFTAEENKHESSNARNQSSKATSPPVETADTPEKGNTNQKDYQAGTETPVEADPADDERAETSSKQQQERTSSNKTENATQADQKTAHTARNGDSSAKDERQLAESQSTQERYQNQRGQALHEKFEGKQISLHEQLVANNSGKSLLDRFKHAPIDDLRSAIGLNERAKYIRELFNGQRQAYFDTIDALNQMETYTEALHYLEHSVKPAHQWENHQEAVESFMELVYRRFVSSASDA